MGLKKNVFGSEKERQQYYKLSRLWGEKFQIYHNLPFLQIFTTDNLFDVEDKIIHPLILSSNELENLKKTSVDYTLCDESDTPLLCIEFDGLQHGFNVGAKYVTPQAKHRQDAKRQYMMNLKLKVAYGSLFPFYVVYSSLFEDVTPDVKLTIIDGIIGEFLAHRATQKQLATGSVAEYYSYSDNEFDNLDPDIKQDLIDGYVTDIEVSAEMENNPIWQKSAELSSELQGQYSSYVLQGISLPDDSDVKTAQERINYLKRLTLVGTKVIIHSKEHGEIVSQIMIPDFDGVTAWTLTQEIALILAFTKLKQLINNMSSKR